MDNEDELKAQIKAKFGRRWIITSVTSPLAPDSAERELKRVYNVYWRLISKELKNIMPGIKSCYKANLRADLRQDGQWDVLSKVVYDVAKAGDRVKEQAKKLKLQERVSKVAKQVRNFSSNEWSRVCKTTLGEDIFREMYDEEFYNSLMNGFVLTALEGAVNMQSDFWEKFQKQISEAYQKGDNITALLRRIQTILNQEKRRSGMTARDVVGSLNADIMKAQCQKAGVTSYIWNAMNDSRVRECHRSLHGKRFDFDNPPEMWYRTKKGIVYTGRFCNPGEDYCCRCTAIPIFDLRNI